jgi:uncharacterized linocin/CFP29 family protein
MRLSGIDEYQRKHSSKTSGQENVDFVIAQDLITAYLGPEGMDHLFRVFESVILRVKRPESICIF